MREEFISTRHAACIMIMFIFGSSVIMGVSSASAQDSWISLLMAVCMAIPIVLLYGRIIQLFPEKDLYDIIEELFGKIGGQIFVILITWYALHLGSLVLRNFSEFTKIVDMPETPQLPIMIAMLMVTVYMARSGVETLGKWSLVMLPIVILVVILTVLTSIPHMIFSNILPVLSHPIGEVSKGAYQLFTFPFAETVLFLCIAGSLKREDSPYKFYLHSLMIGGGVLLAVILRNLWVLGAPMVAAEYFPSYIAARIINIGDFVARIEGSISMNFFLAGIVKITVCLLAASKGVAHFFNVPDYRKLLMPVSLLMLALCAIVYTNTMEMFAFLKVYEYYAIPFQIIIPILIWIIAEIKTRAKRARQSG